MRLRMIGLGGMAATMKKCATKEGRDVVMYIRTRDAAPAAVDRGATAAQSMLEFVCTLSKEYAGRILVPARVSYQSQRASEPYLWNNGNRRESQ